MLCIFEILRNLRFFYFRFYTGQEGGQVVFWNLEEQGDDNEISISDVFQTKLPSVTAIKSMKTNNKDK